MKKKLIIISLTGAIISIIIYIFTLKDNITITAIGDGLSLGMTPYNIEGYSFNDYLKEDYKTQHKLDHYYYEFASSHKTIKELIYEIKENKTLTINNQEINIKQAINKAQILTISIGTDELANTKLTRQVREEFLEDYEELLSMINLLNQYTVIVLGIYQTNNQDALSLERLNTSLRDLVLNNNFIYIDINNLLGEEKYFFNNESYYLNYLGHEKIYKEIKKYVNNY